MESVNTPLDNSTPNSTSIDDISLNSSIPDITSIDVTDSNTDEAWKIGEENYVKWHKRIHSTVTVAHALLVVGYFLLFGVVITKGFPLDNNNLHSKIQELFLMSSTFLTVYSFSIPIVRNLFNFYNPANFNKFYKLFTFSNFFNFLTGNLKISSPTEYKIVIIAITLIITLIISRCFALYYKSDIIQSYKDCFLFSCLLMSILFVVIALDMIASLYTLVHKAKLKKPSKEYKKNIDFAESISIFVISMAFFFAFLCYGFIKELFGLYLDFPSQLDYITKN
ncbi:hypothetical protein NEAUS03_2012 [Nematocida ausubeli]|nr:hypothetical protein NEAUS03_2012 [Nematocida ausubeli]